MNTFTSLILVLMLTMALVVFLANVPLFIIMSIILKGHQEKCMQQFQNHQQWTIQAIATLSEHHSQQMQQITLNLFGEMKRLSGKIPTVPVVNVSTVRKQSTDSFKQLPVPVPIPTPTSIHAPLPVLMDREHDEGHDHDRSPT